MMAHAGPTLATRGMMPACDEEEETSDCKKVWFEGRAVYLLFDSGVIISLLG